MILMMELGDDVVVPLAWMRVRVEAELTLLPLAVSQGLMISTFSRRIHLMEVNLEREATGISLRHLHLPKTIMTNTI